MIKKILLISLIVASILLVGCTKNDPAVESFASCLTEKGAVMYGAYWCGHCKTQKKQFGDAFSKVKYVECTQQEELCTKEGVTGYPTWKFKDGTSLPGTQSFETLASVTGCKAP